MRRWSRTAGSALAALAMVVVAAGPAAAAPMPDQWWFRTWGVQSMLWPAAMGNGVTVAVVDSGVQASLPDLEGVVLAGTDIDNGGDGRTDKDPDDGHGTGMASLIAAQGKGTGLVGVAPRARILPVIARDASAYAKGIRYAADHGAQVISLSRARPGPCPADMQQAITHAVQKNAVVVAAAGDDGNGRNESMAPANCKGTLAVGAVGPNLRPWVKTQRQPYVTIAAPGVRTRAVLRDGELYLGNGTTDAAALTSGIVALVRSKYPKLSGREVVRRLIASSLDVGDKGRDEQTGYGLIRPWRIFAGKLPAGSANPVYAAHDKWVKENASAGSKPRGVPPASSSDGGGSQVLAAWIGAGILLFVGVAALAGWVIQRRRRAAAAGPEVTAPLPQIPADGAPFPGGPPPGTFAGTPPPGGTPPGGTPLGAALRSGDSRADSESAPLPAETSGSPLGTWASPYAPPSPAGPDHPPAPAQPARPAADRPAATPVTYLPPRDPLPPHTPGEPPPEQNHDS